MSTRHVHLIAAGALVSAATFAGFAGYWVGSFVLAGGAIVALIHWKAAKSGLVA